MPKEKHACVNSPQHKQTKMQLDMQQRSGGDLDVRALQRRARDWSCALPFGMACLGGQEIKVDQIDRPRGSSCWAHKPGLWTMYRT